MEKIGLDAIVFLRFTTMLRNIFLVMSVLGLAVMIPVNVLGRNKDISRDVSAIQIMTPMFLFGRALWSHVVCVWAFDTVIAYFLWHNYRKIREMRRSYFQSSEFQMSLHARTVMITDIPSSMRTDEGILRITDEVDPTRSSACATIGRDVKILSQLIEEHEDTVKNVEAILAKYLKNPDNVSSKRPMIRVPRKYSGESVRGKVDAIEYLTNRIRELEQQIWDVRERIDNRDAMPYGFITWEQIEPAHLVAYAARNKHPKGAAIELATRPNDIIWENLGLEKAPRRVKRLMNWVWVTVLTLLWTPLNAAIAIFLSNLSNLASVWHGFQDTFYKYRTWWSIVQGVASPAITSLVYLILPIIFRRLSIRAGDATKTSRERHVIHNLYAFFVFNNLIVFSLFSAIWAFVAAVIEASRNDDNAWAAVKAGDFYTKVMISLCTVSPFWVTWLLQRNLGAAIDLAQLVHLTGLWFYRTFMSPTPRQTIEWTAPPPFDYASYYNYFLFYATVALCFSTLQPIVLPVTALYFTIDAFLKRYLLMYVYITKIESGGQVWRVLYNRMIFATVLSNIIIGLIVIARGTWFMIAAGAPAPLLMVVFKWYCMKVFDDDIRYYVHGPMRDRENLAVGSEARNTNELGSKFGHPALHKPLITPMVDAKARHVLGQVYRGRLNSDGGQSVAFPNIAMEEMQYGKVKPLNAPFEVVPAAQQDFTYYKHRADFREAFGGEIYGRPEDFISERRHASNSLTLSPSPDRGRIPRKDFDETHVNPALRSGHTTYWSTGKREPVAADLGARGDQYTGLYPDESRSNLLGNAQGVGTDNVFTGPLGEQVPLERWTTRETGYSSLWPEDDHPSGSNHF